MDRALDYGSSGWEFDSLRAHTMSRGFAAMRNPCLVQGPTQGPARAVVGPSTQCVVVPHSWLPYVTGIRSRRATGRRLGRRNRAGARSSGVHRPRIVSPRLGCASSGGVRLRRRFRSRSSCGPHHVESIGGAAHSFAGLVAVHAERHGCIGVAERGGDIGEREVTTGLRSKQQRCRSVA